MIILVNNEVKMVDVLALDVHTRTAFVQDTNSGETFYIPLFDVEQQQQLNQSQNSRRGILEKS